MLKRKNIGNLIVISGPSGCGKTSISKSITSNNPKIIESVSMTTRLKRDDEVEGIDYYFVTKEEFQQNIKDNKFLEYAIVHESDFYGTPKENVIKMLNDGYDVLLVIDVQGALKVKELYKEAICIFILPPSIKELKERLFKRGTDTRDKLYKRFQSIYKELNEISKYNYVVINDKLDLAVSDVLSIIRSEKCRVDRIMDLNMNSIEEEIHECLVDL